MRKMGADRVARVAVNMRKLSTAVKIRSIIGCRELGVVTDRGDCS
jgi:hypothetical protein